MISPAKTRSGWSVRVSSGKKCSDSKLNFLSSSKSSFMPLPVCAETGTIASKS